MGQGLLLLLCCIVNTACPQDVPAEGPRLPEEEGAALCRLQPTAVGVPDDAESSVPPAGAELLLVPEGVAVGAAVAVVEAPAPGVDCRLEAEGSFGLEAVGGRFTLVTRAALDREQRAEYNLTLVTERIGEGEAARPITVRLTDVNDNPPVFGQSAYRALVMENGRSNRTLLTVAASDRDSGANGRVTYSIVSPDVPWPLGIHPATGAVYSLAPLDHERARRVDLVVEARDGGHPPARATVPVRLDVGDLNDNSPVFTAPAARRLTVALGVGGGCAGGAPPAGDRSLLPVTALKAVDADSGRNGELVYELAAADGGVFGLGSGGELRANVCGVSRLLEREWRVSVRVRDRGIPSLSASTVLTISFVAAPSGRLGRPAVTGIALGAVCGTLLPALLLLRVVCGKRRRRDGGAYNCRRAETDYSLQPRRPKRSIQKTDIALLRRSRTEPPAVAVREPDGPGPSPAPRTEADPRHRQLLRQLVRLSRAGCPDGSLELAVGSPHVQQISQLLSLLHQGQFQARPNFRGNKYLKNCRPAVPEADRGSLKDSGQGESEEGDSDSGTGRTSHIDQLLEDGLSDLLARGSWTAPAGSGSAGSAVERLSLEELCWTLPSTLPSDYKENVFNPKSPEAVEMAATPADGEKTTFLTFGKGGVGSCRGAEQEQAGLLTGVSVLFQQLLLQKAETYGQPSPELLRRLSARWSVLCEGEVDRGRGRRLPGLLETPEQGAGPEQLLQ
ncbi:protocadherin-18-like [Pristis pectinata]|uniref:protocadherin-18-like n=1 Tax=Pristis pectinata TaxID=685728 RepID=UPI00223E52B4|nr:protocadherin-18-like [Pristis pectinata]